MAARDLHGMMAVLTFVASSVAIGNGLFCKSVLDEQFLLTNRCRLMDYKSQHVAHCLDLLAQSSSRNVSIYFIGDSRIRQQFESFMAVVPRELFRLKVVEVERTGPTPHEDFDYFSDLFGVRIVCLWRPVINQKLLDELDRWSNSTDAPSFILLGIGAHHMYYRYVQDVASFERNLTRLEPAIRKLSAISQVVWWNQFSTLDNHYPLRYLNPELFKIYSEKMEAFNRIARRILKDSGVSMWTSGYSLAEEYIRSCQLNHRANPTRFHNCADFIHTGLVAVYNVSQLLYNHLCNRLLLDTQTPLAGSYSDVCCD